MPVKKFTKKKVRKDKKQDSRIKKLESFVYKTIENKQVNFTQSLNISSAGTYSYPFIQLTQGTGDGNAMPSASRIGNSITLMSQRFDANLIGETAQWNQIRVLLVESVDGATALQLSDVLEYSNYALNGDLVFVSPYTTKTSTNKRYKVHMDRLVELHGTGDAGKATAQLHKVIRWKNGKVLKFDDNNAGVTNHLMHLFCISDSASVSHPTIKYNVRSTYKDA